MRYTTTAGALVACAAVTAAFKDTSPYILFSTSKLPSTLKDPSTRQLQSSADVLETTKEFLKSCPSDTYIIVSQPTVNAADLSGSKVVPHFRRAISNKDVKTRISISEVVGKLNPEDLQEYIISHCDATVMRADPSRIIELPPTDPPKPLIIRTDFASLPTVASERAVQLAENDYSLFQSVLVDTFPSARYTVIYTTTPPSNKIVHSTESYVPEFMEPLHMELKRRSDYNVRGSNNTNSTVRDQRSLFEKYQFFTPGLFMGLLVSFILLAILSVGMSALASLQVSYRAFDKEMGPAAQKKQQ